MTRRTFLIGLLVLAFAFSGAWPGPNAAKAASDVPGGFVTGLDDVPLMAGLTEDADSALVFETPEGRIVEVDAVGPQGADIIGRFYAETLPQLGWRKQGPARFAREDEILKLDFSKTPAGTRVRFRLGPRN